MAPTKSDPAVHFAVIDREGARAIELHLAPELHGATGHRGLSAPFHTRFELPRHFAVLGVHGHQSTSTGRGYGTIWVRCSRTLDSTQSTPAVEISPEVGSLQVSYRGTQLQLRGYFDHGRRYTITIPESLRDEDGQRLSASRTLTYDVPERQPAIAMRGGSGMLSPHGALEIDVTTTKLDRVDVRVDEVHENNLVAYLQGHDPGYTTTNVTRSSHAVGPTTDQGVAELALDLRALVPNPRGVHRVRVSAHKKWSPRARQLLNVTDVTLTTVRDRNGVLVWATSIIDGTPFEGATVTIRSVTNQVMARGVSDADGLVHLTLPTGSNQSAWIATATTDDGDLTYTLLGETRAVAPGVDLSGRAEPAT